MGGTVGIIGGSGMLGRAIAHGLVAGGAVEAQALWVSNRSGVRDGLPPGVTLTTSNAALAEACEVILLCVPPAQAGAIGIAVPDRLVLSVMAGVTRARMTALTGAGRVVRAMTSPAAAEGLAFTAWIASEAATAADRARAEALFSALGAAAEVPKEDQIDIFTALTGPVPGFVALFADCVEAYARSAGIAPEVADRAVRQLFLASGRALAEDPKPAAAHVREMIDYAGTTAAGLGAMQRAGLGEVIAEGLAAAVARARSIGGE